MISDKKNTFKSTLKSGVPLIGLWLSSTSSYLAEIAATCHYDWVLIDGEHAPNTLSDIYHQLQAIAPYPVSPVVRPAEFTPAITKQLLDIDAQTLLFPMVDTAEQASMIVLATRYPPSGIRGVGASVARASRWGRFENYMSDAEKEICILIQVESCTAIKNLDAILDVDGIDGIFIGPADLSASLGHPGDPMHEDVQTAIKNAITKIKSAGKSAGFLAVDTEMAKRVISWGANFVAVGVDTMLYTEALDKRLQFFKDNLQIGPQSSY